MENNQENGFCYSEYSYYLYSNVNLVNSALLASNVSMQKNADKKLYVLEMFSYPLQLFHTHGTEPFPMISPRNVGKTSLYCTPPMV